jgi:cytochrome bd-I ubiquinol oxidase subunit X
MWYFSWILGVGLACSFGILNAMWYEFRDEAEKAKAKPDDSRPAT